MTEFTKFTKLISLKELFEEGKSSGKSLSQSSDTVKYYVTDSETEDEIGFVLFLSMDLRDGPILVFVDDCGHTQVFDSYKQVKKEYESPEDLYISQLTEDYAAINKIYAEFKNEFHGPYFEIHKLRQQLKSLSNGNT